MRTQAIAMVLAAIGVAACSTTQTPTVVNSAQLQVPLVITERQREACVAVDPQLGDSKLQLIAKAQVEIGDCEAKRAALQATIDKENAKREADNKREQARLAKGAQ